MKKLFGIFLLGWPFAAILAALAYDQGILAMLAVVAAVVVLFGTIIWGIDLVLD